MPHFSSHAGTWTGTNELWMDPAAPAEFSDATASVETSSLRYTWSFRGRPQSGVVELGGAGDAIEAAWTDTWHQSTGVMRCAGTAAPGRVDVRGTYPAGEGPDWGWRTVIDTSDPDRLVVLMFNIPPEGEEQRAVRISLARA